MGAIRGAICADNTSHSISEQAVTVVEEILIKNNLNVNDVDAIFFSVTDDLDACYPAQAVRERFALNNIALMCFSEMCVQDSLDHCIRVCVFAPKIGQKDCKHCYIGRARSLRPDL